MVTWAPCPQAKLAAAAKFNALSSAMIEMKRAGKYDEESLKMSMKVLEMNPEFYSVWNFRRQIFSALTKSSPDTVGAALWGELQLLEGAIAKNAKAYCLWTHRLWVIDRLVELGDPEVLGKELVLCTKFLKLDERNFHCWGYVYECMYVCLYACMCIYIHI